MLPVLLLAPLWYGAVGLPWAALVGRVAWAPLCGIAVCGVGAELAVIAGGSVPVTLVAIGLGHLGWSAWLLARRPAMRPEVGMEFTTFARLYLIALIPFVAAPFSTPGLWSGDWYLALQSGEYLRQNLAFSPALLARPPFFGAASIPLLLAGPTLPAFQIYCAVASACALQLFRTALPASAPRAAIWVLAGSLFFLQVTLNAWPKFLSAAFLLAAWQVLDRVDVRRGALAGIFLGLALATHQAALLFAPVLLVRLLATPASMRSRAGQLLAAAGLAAVIVLPWEIHTVLTYGWEAKVLANPAVSQRLAEIPGWLNALLVGAGTLAGWGPLHVAHHWLRAPDWLMSGRIAQESYWLVTSAFNSLAASLLGVVLPWWLAIGAREFPRRLGALWRGTGWPMRGAFALALAGQMLLNPYYSSDGSLHTGWVPAGLGLVFWLAGDLATRPAAEWRAVLRWTVGLGTLPWLAFQLGLTVALVLSARFRSVFFDSDLRLVEQHGWTTVALGGFPWVQGAAAAIGFGAWRRARRDAA